MGRIQVAEGDLAVAVAKKQRLSRAKEILMMRSGIDMNRGE
jgi:AmiR/NasT family two-component response regulator